MFEQFETASGIIFDCDGCLLDSMRVWERVEMTLIERTGRPWTQDELEEMRAASLTEAAKIFHERHGLLESNEAVERYVYDTMWEYYTGQAQLKPGVATFIARVRSLGIPLAVVSSTPHAYLQAGFERVGIADELAGIFSTQETGISKQDPAIYELALRSMLADAATAWGFDDSLYAIRVMKRLGLRTVGTYDSESAGSLEELRATATLAITSFEELLV